MDIRDFHAASKDRPVVPVLLSTQAKTRRDPVLGASLEIHCVGARGLADRLHALSMEHDDATRAPIHAVEWDRSHYSPTPTIIQATQALFAGHSVANLSHAYADNLDVTVDAVCRAARRAQAEQRHTICFITGVPGAGKTLAGLSAIQAATTAKSAPGRGAYLSGNGPLVRILREAPARNAAQDAHTTKRAAMRRASTLVQNVHEFIHEYGINRPDLAPDEHIVAFDEAQRAWHAEKLIKRHATATASEPGLMLDIMSRAQGWSLIVAIVGGGQEIHSGEAGLEEWGRALSDSPVAWRVLAPPQVLAGDDSTAFHKLFSDTIPSSMEVIADPSMHLSVSVRSPRARHLSEWINAVLELDAGRAAHAIAQIDGFRMGLT